MPDISMCMNQACPSHELCFRFMAKPSDYQYYSKFAPPEGAAKCWYFEPIGLRGGDDART